MLKFSRFKIYKKINPYNKKKKKNSSKPRVNFYYMKHLSIYIVKNCILFLFNYFIDQHNQKFESTTVEVVFIIEKFISSLFYNHV